MITKEEAIRRSIEVHGEKYDYSKVSFSKVTDEVTIICPIHGEFTQVMRQHYRGQGCPLCGITKRAKSKSDTTESYIKKAKQIWGDTYDYSKVVYAGTTGVITITCPKHGDFQMVARNHLNSKNGCPICANKARRDAQCLTRDQYIAQARKIHGNKYDYSKVVYINQREKVIITCPKHGDFLMIAGSHTNDHQGCPKCAREKQAQGQILGKEEFIRRSRKKHGDKYDYSKVEYVDGKTPVTIICPKHGDFQQKPWYHMAGNGCPKCGAADSKAENEIYEFCGNLLGKENVIKGTRKEIYPYEIDIFIPSLKIGIEYNGVVWHSTDFVKDNNYHLKKLQACQKKGIKLIQIFEDEYVNHKEIVLEKLKHLLHVQGNYPKVMARKCSVEKVPAEVAKTFLEKNHIQGYANSTLHLGAFYNGELMGVMSFREEEKGTNTWELTRFAANNKYVCQGIGGKLFKFFVNAYDPKRVKSFADRRWTIDEENNLYINLGFEFDSYVKPDYHYIHPGRNIVREHKFKFRKQILHKKYGFPLTMTETQMTKKLGYRKIYDCGLIKYVYIKK